MKKSEAIEMLGGTPTRAAAAIGIRPQAVSQWPDELSRAVEDRVIAAKLRLDQCQASPRPEVAKPQASTDVIGA